MEQYFDETKGDLKYILEEERQKEKAEPQIELSQHKRVVFFDRFWNWLLLLLFKKSRRQNKLKATIPIFIEIFY